MHLHCPYSLSVPVGVGFKKRYSIYPHYTAEQLIFRQDFYFLFDKKSKTVKIMKNNSNYSILERFRISQKFALFYMLFVSFIFLLRGIVSIISHLGIIFVWSTIFGKYVFWTKSWWFVSYTIVYSAVSDFPKLEKFTFLSFRIQNFVI